MKSPSVATITSPGDERRASECTKIATISASRPAVATHGLDDISRVRTASRLPSRSVAAAPAIITAQLICQPV